MDKQKEQNRMFWDVVKGLGMLCIVAGHTCPVFPDVIRFVYLFHLAIFFFVSGFLYSEERYGDAPWKNAAARLRSMWPRYVGYMMVYILLHNFFLKAGIIIHKDPYSFMDVIIQSARAILLAATEDMGGALWFVPVLIIASSLWGGMVYIGRKAVHFTGNEKAKAVTALLLAVVTGAAGVYMNCYGHFYPYHFQTSLVVIPLFFVAWWIRTYVKDWTGYLRVIPGMLSAATLIYGMKRLGWGIGLVSNGINGPISFYLISALGIYMCLTAAKCLLHLPIVNAGLALIGKYSFDIMASHFLVIKIIDLGYAKMIGETDPAVFGSFPCAYASELWWLYVIACLAAPILAVHPLNKRMKSSANKLRAK